MNKIFSSVLYLLIFLSIGAVHSRKQEDVEKLDSFLKKEDPVTPLDLVDQDMRSYDLVNPEGKGKEFTSANMEGANFSGKDLKGIKFTKVNLKGANFEGAKLSGVSFTECNLAGASFKNAKLMYGGMRDSNFSNIDFTGSKLESIGFTNVKLTGAKFDNADLFRVSLVDVDKESICLENTTIRDCSGFGWFS